MRQFGNVICLSIICCMLISCSANKNQKCLSLKLEPIDGRVYQEAGSTLVDSRSVLTDSEHFVWGGTVVEGDDGRYHMFYSIFNQGENEPRFSDAWLLSSKIAYAVSDYPDRDFKFKKIVLKGAREDGKPEAWDAQGVHNPHIRKFNGKYYLYYIGSRDPGEKPAGDPGANLNMRNRIQQVQKVAVIAVDRLEDLIEARFTRPEKALLEARTRVKPDDVIDPSPSGTIPLPDNLIVVNPTVEYRPSDGKYLMYFKGNLYDPGWRGAHGLALADNPEGPFSPLDDFMFDLRMEDGRIASAEDPYVWYHPETELFYAVFKDFQGKFTGVEPGLAMMISKDGLSWELHPEPFFSEKRIAFSDGSKLKVANLERPQFLINNAGIPLAFYAACSVENCGSKRDGSTFNVHFKVNVSYLDFP